MPRLTELTRYADAHAHFAPARLWELFDGDRAHLNIAHECIDRHPAADVAVRLAHADGRDELLTFGEIAAASSRMAHWLAARGIARGDRVALMLEPGPAFYAGLFGAIKMGAIAVPLFTAFGADGLAARLEDCGARLLLVEPAKAETAAGIAGLDTVIADAAFLDGLAGLPDRFETASRADDLAVFQYTSGTTRALPEAVKHSHRALVVVMIAALYGTGIRPGDRYFCPSSPAWGHGLWHGTLAPLGIGVPTGTMVGKFDPERLLRALQDFGITNLSAAATHYRMMRTCGSADRYGHAIEKLSFTGEPIDEATRAFAQQHFGTPVCSMYGTTEVGVIIADYPGGADHAVRPGALGKPVPGCIVEVQAPDGTPCPPGVPGEIKVRRHDAWFPTKDLGHVDADGYFFHRGRADDVIISAGWTMSAVEIENALLKHPEVREAAVIGVPDAVRGQIVKAFVVATRPGDDDLARALQDFTRERLSRHEYPRALAFVAELPKTPAGKVNRNVLRAQEALTRQADPQQP